MNFTLQSAFFAEMSTLLILLAGAVLLYSSFREKYLIPWISGWACLTFAKIWFVVDRSHASPVWGSLSIVFFILGLGLLVAAVLFYTSQRKLILPLALMLTTALTMGLLYGLVWPYPALRVIAQLLCWGAKALASIQLVRFAWGRRTTGRWLLAAMFLLLHLDVAQLHHRLITYDFLVDLLLGIGMMTVVLEDSRIQIQRLDALNTITQQVSDARDFAPVIDTILDELRKITRAKATWFRILQLDTLVLAGQRGVSENYT